MNPDASLQSSNSKAIFVHPHKALKDAPGAPDLLKMPLSMAGTSLTGYSLQIFCSLQNIKMLF